MLKTTINRVADSGSAWLGFVAILFLCSLGALAEDLSWLNKFVFWAGFVGYMVPWQFPLVPGSATARVVKHFWLVSCAAGLLIWLLGAQFNPGQKFEATLSWMMACFWLSNPHGSSSGFLKQLMGSKAKSDQTVERQ
ncbi:hypothetical protein [Pseudomonas mosselii]|uniref:hypothetical protein n=1 Tax=Pseudomonas mosselii TaxID=78327 RepID=UPI0021D927E0|nr:hypothetical protein [Pseudomonas mosselii]MCU9528365.1 hypothetical protein [Pseudomonas mosselii]MCU9535538.1 hypothetical protein [Pseudomonas mosselii]MCU9547389.1 hypothetical protein [Pseudomonas mosselii]